MKTLDHLLLLLLRMLYIKILLPEKYIASTTNWTEFTGKKSMVGFLFFTELVASRNILYTVLYTSDLICISKNDGSIQFRYPIGMYGGTPVIVGDQLMVAGNAIYCFSSNAEPALLVEP